MINTYSTIDQSVQDVKKEDSSSTGLATKPRDYKSYVNWGVRLSLSAILVASPLTYFSCNPINVYKTTEIRHKEADLYEIYRKIDMNELTEEEQDYLKKIHQTYGKGPIKLNKLTNMMSKEILQNILYIAGEESVTDRVLIFIHRTSGNLAGALMLNLDGE